MSPKAESQGASGNRDESRTGDAAARAEAGHQQDQSAPSGAPGADLDFESLDLTIETVEERISPSETNVFDK